MRSPVIQSAVRYASKISFPELPGAITSAQQLPAIRLGDIVEVQTFQGALRLGFVSRVAGRPIQDSRNSNIPLTRYSPKLNLGTSHSSHELKRSSINDCVDENFQVTFLDGANTSTKRLAIRFHVPLGHVLREFKPLDFMPGMIDRNSDSEIQKNNLFCEEITPEFHAELELGHRECLAVLSIFESRSKETLISHHAQIQQSIFGQYSSRSRQSIRDHLSRYNLLYERDIASKVFSDAPSSTELYATHLYMYSHTTRIGRDRSFKVSPDIGAGPYFLRSDSDLRLLSEAESLTLDLHNNSVRQLIFKSGTADWQDRLGNPYVAALGAVCESSSGPALYKEPSSAIDALSFGSSNKVSDREVFIGDGRLLDEIDLARERSGLDFHSEDQSINDRSSHFWAENRISPSNTLYRRKFDEPAFAIDSAYTIEIDDAISIAKSSELWQDEIGSSPSGFDTITVHVADPIRLAPPGSQPFHRAMERVSTMYFADRTYRMMPEYVRSAASLASEQDTPTIAFSAQLHPETGDIIRYRVDLATSSNIIRLTPEEVDKHLSNQNHTQISIQESSNRKPDSDISTIADNLKQMAALASRHSEYRLRMGAFSFQLPRARPHRDPRTGRISLSIEGSSTNLDSLQASSLVSECMVIAGRVAAMWAREAGIAVPFRYHNSPIGFIPPSKYSSLADILNLISTPSDGSASILLPSALDVYPRRHDAMGLEIYAKATSPLRRAPDLLLHSQVHSVVHGKPSSSSLSNEFAPRKRLTDSSSIPIHGHRLTLLSRDRLAEILPGIYTHEQYIRRLEAASNRFWTMRYIQQELNDIRKVATDSLSGMNEFNNIKMLSSFIDTTAVLIRRQSFNGRCTIFLPKYAFLHYGADLVGSSSIPVGTEFNCRIIHCDPIRQILDISVREK